MDSLTQFALGATVSALCLGKSIGPRKAAILGGVLGTLPDLDVFLPFDSPVDSFVLHRGWSHAFAIHALAAPVVGEIILRLFTALRDRRALVYLTVFLCFTTQFKSAWSQRLGRAIKTALIFTTAYMGLSIALQAQVTRRSISWSGK